MYSESFIQKDTGLPKTSTDDSAVFTTEVAKPNAADASNAFFGVTVTEGLGHSYSNRHQIDSINTPTDSLNTPTNTDSTSNDALGLVVVGLVACAGYRWVLNFDLATVTSGWLWWA